MNKITVYVTDTCPYCDMMKNYLEEQGLAFTEVNVQRDQIAANRLVQETGQMGVPQTKINDEWIIGFDPNRVKALVK